MKESFEGGGSDQSKEEPNNVVPLRPDDPEGFDDFDDFDDGLGLSEVEVMLS